MTTHRIALLALTAALLAAPFLTRAEDAKPEPTAAVKAENDAIAKLLENKISFEFVDTPLDDALKFFSSLTKVSFVVDPEVVKSGKLPAVNLKVKDMEIKVALGWILKLTELEYSIHDKAVYISKPKK